VGRWGDGGQGDESERWLGAYTEGVAAGIRTSFGETRRINPDFPVINHQSSIISQQSTLPSIGKRSILP